MLSKFLRPSYRQGAAFMLMVRGPQKIISRKMLGLVPPNQYDIPIPNRLKMGYVMRVYWETLPLFFVTFFAFGVMALSILLAFKNKVDCVYQTHSRGNISRIMDLRNPTIHKLILVNQRYEPWPEMADVLDKMKDAEKRALVRMAKCPI